MHKEELLLVVYAALAALFMFLPSLIFNAACMIGYCEYVTGEYVLFAQFVQVCWLAGCLLVEIFTNHFSFVESKKS